ncbi:MAG: general secretion pathway protein GspB [Marinobacter sp.]
MSYILDALRKSETERRQGKVPDLGQQAQMVWRPKKKPVSPVVWVVIALLVNAMVMAYLLWPPSSAEPDAPELAQGPVSAPVGIVSPVADVPGGALEEEPLADNALLNQPVAETRNEAPLVIVPDQSVRATRLTPSDSQGRVPHLVELPLSFQKSVPDLTFNSHIYSSDPAASRVMINNHYLRPGDTFGNLTVERVTDDGVILSRGSQRFRVGTVRDWVSPR